MQKRIKKYPGRIYLFENVLVYTRHDNNSNSLLYQGHFICENISYQCDRPDRIYIRTGDSQIAFSCKDNGFHKWMQSIRYFLI